MGSTISKHTPKSRRSRSKYPLPSPTPPVQLPGYRKLYHRILKRSLLTGLPNELLLEIANYLPTTRDLYALMQVNKHLAFLLDHLLDDILLSIYQASANSHTLFSGTTRYPVPLISRLVRLGIDLNSVICHHDGFASIYCGCMPPLHTAISNSNVTMVDSLLRHGARINVPYNTSGDNAVHLSIQASVRHSGYFEVLRRDDLKILQMVLGGGRLQSMNDAASLNSKGVSWLHMAVRSCPRTHVTIVEPFLARGLCVDVADRHRQLTPLHMAVWNNRVDLAKLLLDLGADYQTVDWRGNTPFMTACLRPNCGLIDLLLRRDSTLIDAVDETGETAVVLLQREIDRLQLNGDPTEDYYTDRMRELQRLLAKLKKLSMARSNQFLSDSGLRMYYHSL